MPNAGNAERGADDRPRRLLLLLRGDVTAWLYVPLLTIGIGGPCVLLWRWATKPPKFDRADKVSGRWLDDHAGGRYTHDGK